jgi:hypothetical protein
MSDAAVEVQPAPEASTEEPAEYAIVEIMGFRKLAGRILEAERFGAKLLRIDIPTKGDFANGFTSQYYSGSSIFSITPTDLATVCKHNKPYEPARLYSPAPQRDPDTDDGGSHDGGDDDDRPF